MESITRRGFLRGSAAAVAALGANGVTSVSATAKPAERPVLRAHHNHVHLRGRAHAVPAGANAVEIDGVPYRVRHG